MLVDRVKLYEYEKILTIGLTAVVTAQLDDGGKINSPSCMNPSNENSLAKVAKHEVIVFANWETKSTSSRIPMLNSIAIFQAPIPPVIVKLFIPMNSKLVPKNCAAQVSAKKLENNAC